MVYTGTSESVLASVKLLSEKSKSEVTRKKSVVEVAPAKEAPSATADDWERNTSYGTTTAVASRKKKPAKKSRPLKQHTMGPIRYQRKMAVLKLPLLSHAPFSKTPTASNANGNRNKSF